MNLMSVNKQPRMCLRLSAPTKEQKELLELVLLCVGVYIPCTLFINFYHATQCYLGIYFHRVSIRPSTCLLQAGTVLK